MLLYFLGGLEGTDFGPELGALVLLIAAQSFLILLHFRTVNRTSPPPPDYVFALPALAFLVLFVPIFATSWTGGLLAAGAGFAGLIGLVMFPSGNVQLTDHDVTIQMGRKRWGIAYTNIARIAFDKVNVPLIGWLLGTELCVTPGPNVSKPGLPFAGRASRHVFLPVRGAARLELHNLLQERVQVPDST